MAVGDVINDIQNIAANADLDFQPAAGTEIVINSIGSDGTSAGATPAKTPLADVKLYNGSLESDIIRNGETAGWEQIKIWITNTNYLRINNADGANARDISYTGVAVAV